MTWLLLALAPLLAAGPVSVSVPQPSPGPAAADTAIGYRLPVPGGRIVEPFVAPADRYGPGHRGVDLATGAYGMVRAAADGTVRFAGRVAGRGVVVLAHADGLVTEYEPVRPSVRIGARLSGGAVLGRVDGTHRTCRPNRCLHWAARRGDVYLDPMTLLADLGPVRLLPRRA